MQGGGARVEHEAPASRDEDLGSGLLDILENMGGEHDTEGLMLPNEIPNGVLEIRPSGGVETGSRLVEDEQISPVR